MRSVKPGITEALVIAGVSSLLKAFHFYGSNILMRPILTSLHVVEKSLVVATIS